MEEIAEGLIVAGAGLEGDHKGAKFPRRGITVLAREGWETACAVLESEIGPVHLPWTVRRANLLVEGLALPKSIGSIVQIGPVVLEVTFPTQPCARMEEAHNGLLKALHPDWRGGFTARVLEGGRVRIGDTAEVLHALPERVMRLPA